MRKDKAGFSIPELLIAMLIGLVIVGAIYSFFTMQNKQFSTQEQLTEMQQNARMAMVMITRDLSMAGFNQTSSLCPSPVTAVRRCTGTITATNTPCTGITHAGADTISFSADLNANCNIEPGTANPNENIAFNLDSSSGTPSLNRINNGTKLPVVEYVDALSFAYYDGDGNITVDLARIRKIKISITIRTAKPDPSYTHPTAGDHYRRYTLESFVVPRNLGTYNMTALPASRVGTAVLTG